MRWSGFIGSNFIHYLIRDTETEVLNLDLLTYAGNPDTLTDVADSRRYRFIQGDIGDAVVGAKAAGRFQARCDRELCCRVAC